MGAEPITKTVRIPKSPEILFDQLSTELPNWWPKARDQLGESRMQTIVLDQREGGRIYERLKDGTELQWGTVEIWDPPRRLRLSFHPDREESEAQVVDVTFQDVDGETEVSLIHTGWEHLGPDAPAARDRLDTGWEPVLGRLASDRS